MPKKFQGENTKSAAARARRAEAKAAADARKQKELEDAYWRDEDKHVMRKEQRKVGVAAGTNERRVGVARGGGGLSMDSRAGLWDEAMICIWVGGEPMRRDVGVAVGRATET
jgi:hypothetical protein